MPSWLYLCGILIIPAQASFSCWFSISAEKNLGAVLYVLLYLPAFFTASPGDPLSLTIGNYGIGFEAGALLALPLIFLHTNTSLRIPKWFFYAFYPAHLALIALVRFLLGF